MKLKFLLPCGPRQSWKSVFFRVGETRPLFFFAILQIALVSQSAIAKGPGKDPRKPQPDRTFCAEIVKTIGRVTFRKTATSDSDAIYEVGKAGAQLFPGDLVETQKRSAVRLRFRDNSEITLGESSKFQVQSYSYEKKNSGSLKETLVSKWEIFSGRLFASIRGRSSSRSTDLNVKASNFVMGVRGTEFLLKDVSSKGASLIVKSGKVAVSDPSVRQPETVVSDQQSLRVVSGESVPASAQPANNADLSEVDHEQVAEPQPPPSEPENKEQNLSTRTKESEEEKSREKKDPSWIQRFSVSLAPQEKKGPDNFDHAVGFRLSITKCFWNCALGIGGEALAYRLQDERDELWGSHFPLRLRSESHILNFRFVGIVPFIAAGASSYYQKQKDKRNKTHLALSTELGLEVQVGWDQSFRITGGLSFQRNLWKGGHLQFPSLNFGVASVTD